MFVYSLFREGFHKKRQIIHILWIKKSLMCILLIFINVDKPKGGGRTMWIRLFC